ncbi:MAG: alpha-2-macroglobulin family protein [Verrucomicrobiota bacterium]|nr:alpha-2-macroglobulin family protein [Verrucomicrobiota bacterium]
MKWFKPVLGIGLCAVVLLLGLAADTAAPEGSPADTRQKAQKAKQSGNWKDAYNLFEKLALDHKNDAEVCDDLQNAEQCLQRLGRISEFDDFVEKVVKAHDGNWRLLMTSAQQYDSVAHYGHIIAGKYERGSHHGGGRLVNSLERDRIRALQLMELALKKSKGEKNQNDLADLHLKFADMLLTCRSQQEAWRLQYLSDLSKLPDYEDGYGWIWGRRDSMGAPVDPDNKPVYHYLPKSYEAAATDGERRRWMLIQAMELAPQRANKVLFRFASFLHQQFGTETMAQYSWCFRDCSSDDDKKNQPQTYVLHTLKDTETIARLATGVQRFNLPDEFNFITIYRKIADRPNDGGKGEDALNALAQLYENRRQFDQAADYWKRSIKEYGAGHYAWKQKKVDQILGNWGLFEGTRPQPAGKGATFEFRFRNGRKVTFEAKTVDTRRLFDDVKAYLKSGPKQLDRDRMNIGDIGYRLVQGNGDKYIGQTVATWDLALEPRALRFDRRVTIATPLQKPGAYWITARMEGGNTCHSILWVDDTVIVKKPLDGGAYYFTADAVTGAPVAKANLEFFGYRQNWREKSRDYEILTQNFAEFSDQDGQLILKKEKIDQHYQWVITATTPEGRFAHLGFTGLWFGEHHDSEYNQLKVYGITDRPVYRPNQSVKFKFWVREAKYDQEDTSRFANQDFVVVINNAKNEKIFEKTFKTDAYAGLDGEFTLPKDAALGVYYAHVMQGDGRWGDINFRVEEYKKPEFEVKVEAPEEPVMLGEKITAQIKAKYYFGAPVTKAKIKYKVLRSDYSADWHPVCYWDWFYGPGYWWFAYDYDWYPGWRDWGCKRPCFWWWPRSTTPPEVVAEAEHEIGPDGVTKVEIDTTLAKEVHGDTDHKYEITAEIVDESRRTIVGAGQVLVARKPFKVYAWVDRGHYRIGDVVTADFCAQTLDRKPVKGTGVLKLLALSYDKDGQPLEKPVGEWKLDTGEEGRASQQIKASKAGQYRLSYTLTDAKRHTIEGGYLFCMMGEGFDGKDFRFDEIELVPDKKEYAAGDNVKLMINTDRKEGTVVFFARPANGVYQAPKVIRLAGKSALESLAVTKKDMPNFFVEAFTISNGRLYEDTREIIVPPEKRVLDVNLETSAKSYKPGGKGWVKVKLTDHFGKPFLGSIVMALYDKSVEYISGGSNVPEIKQFFWKWRRHHRPSSECTLARFFHNLVRPKQDWMQVIGVFGHSIADEGELEQAAGDPTGSRIKRGKGGFGRGETEGMRFGAAPPAATVAARSSMFDAFGAERGADDGMVMDDQDDDKREMLAKNKSAPGGAHGEAVEPMVRTQFADTALWVGSLTTDADGFAKVDLTMPENLTSWKLRAWACGHGTKVGEGSAEVVTAKKLMLRLQAPRFFVEKDEVVLSANIHNYLDKEKSVHAVLELDGRTVEILGKPAQTVKIKAGGEQRVDWRVKALNEGEAVVRMKALTDEESDAMETRFPVYVHGMMKMESFCGVIRPEKDTAKITITVPRERRPDESRLEIRYSPTLAGALVDALPYLASYPYGCTEQTLNRFLPSVITQKILMGMGIDLRKLKERRANLNAQEIGNDQERAGQWKKDEMTVDKDGNWAPKNPIYDPDVLEDMVKENVQALTAMQCPDGGWGWFSGCGEHSRPHTTAVVVHGLQVAHQNDVALVPGVLDRGVAWLRNYQAEQIRRIKNAPSKTHPWKERADDLDALVYMVLVDARQDNKEMREFLYRDRIELSVYAKAVFGIALHAVGDKEKLDMVKQNVEQYLVEDNENQTAWLKLPNQGCWWYWYGSETETLAWYLKLLAKTEPKSEKASRLVKYLLNNRKHATYWNSTRDTAYCIEAMSDYLKASGEDKPDMTLQIFVDGKQRKEVRITAENLFACDNKLVLEDDAVESGKHEVTFKKTGKGPLYFNAYLSNFTLEDPITKAGLEIKVERKVYKLVKLDQNIKACGSRGQAVDQKVEKYERKPVENLGALKSGDLVEIEMEIASKNDYEYVVFEDMKAAGFEPVEVRSGYNKNDLGAYMELRDERVCFFTRVLARGNHSVAYRMRAEIPGKFSALPARAHAMYAPELKANSDEIKLRIED